MLRICFSSEIVRINESSLRIPRLAFLWARFPNLWIGKWLVAIDHWGYFSWLFNPHNRIFRNWNRLASFRRVRATLLLIPTSSSPLMGFERVTRVCTTLVGINVKSLKWLRSKMNQLLQIAILLGCLSAGLTILRGMPKFIWHCRDNQILVLGALLKACALLWCLFVYEYLRDASFLKWLPGIVLLGVGIHLWVKGGGTYDGEGAEDL